MAHLSSAPAPTTTISISPWIPLAPFPSSNFSAVLHSSKAISRQLLLRCKNTRTDPNSLLRVSSGLALPIMSRVSMACSSLVVRFSRSLRGWGWSLLLRAFCGLLAIERFLRWCWMSLPCTVSDYNWATRCVGLFLFVLTLFVFHVFHVIVV